MKRFYKESTFFKKLEQNCKAVLLLIMLFVSSSKQNRQVKEICNAIS